MWHVKNHIGPLKEDCMEQEKNQKTKPTLLDILKYFQDDLIILVHLSIKPF